MTKAETPWVFLDHTADILMEIHGRDLEELFIHAAMGFSQMLTPDPGASSDLEINVSLEADTVEDLMVDWLRELLFLNQARAFVLVEPRLVKLSETRIEARLLGRESGPTVEPDIEVKAVTYHGISVNRTDKGYTTRIVFDI